MNPPKFDEGDYRSNRKDFAAHTLQHIHEVLAKVRARFGPGATSQEATSILASVACRWVLSHPNVCSTIPGFRNARQAACNLRAATDTPMSDADATWLREQFTA